ncbi:MAG TPA: transcription elongation factor GreA [Xanthomonadales bacterium]|nr:transcription elongation factor GreA [Xanthomonadales bacterium]
MRTPLTQSGADRLREELARLKKVDRPKVIEAIAEARAHGDLKENAEYHAAREQQGFIEGRIQRLETNLAGAQIIDVSKVHANDKVVFGATVTVINIDNDKETTYQIVGDLEADINENRIAVSSPIARALIGRSEEDEVVVQTPGGEQEYEIIKVAYI